MNESCASCRFFAPSAASGVCRRRPPVWTGPDETLDEGMFAFPSVHPTSWCGEYEQGEVPDTTGTNDKAEPVAWWIVPPWPAVQNWQVVFDKAEAERYRDTHFVVRPLYEHPHEGQ